MKAWFACTGGVLVARTVEDTLGRRSPRAVQRSVPRADVAEPLVTTHDGPGAQRSGEAGVRKLDPFAGASRFALAPSLL